MGPIEFLCDIRFHRSFVLPPNPATRRARPLRVSYADYGCAETEAVVLFCGAVMGTRFCYAQLDGLAKLHRVRIIHPDRPGIGGSDAVELHERMPIWLGLSPPCSGPVDMFGAAGRSSDGAAEMVPELLSHLGIAHVSIASHSGGVLYALNTILTHPHILHPHTPYVALFAPWVHYTHSGVSSLKATQFIPAPMVGRFASWAKFVNTNVTPLAGISVALFNGLREALSSVAANSELAGEAEAADIDSSCNDALADPRFLLELQQLVVTYLFAECMDGMSADVQLFLKKYWRGRWGLPKDLWPDTDAFVPLLRKIVEDEKGDGGSDPADRTWIIDAFHAEHDSMVGEQGRRWFDACWNTTRALGVESQGPAEESASAKASDELEYNSNVVADTGHNLILDPQYGASEKWLVRVRESFVEVSPSKTPRPPSLVFPQRQG